MSAYGEDAPTMRMVMMAVMMRVAARMVVMVVRVSMAAVFVRMLMRVGMRVVHREFTTRAAAQAAP